MTPNKVGDLDLSELYGFILSERAQTRARYDAILKAVARILSHLEQRESAEILAELNQIVQEQMKAQSEELKESLTRTRERPPGAPDPEPDA